MSGRSEAQARIKINQLLEEAGWRFFDSGNSKANVILENNVKITKSTLDSYGNNFEKVSNGFIDFLLLDSKGFPLVVLEAKSAKYDPLTGKEQARKYANSQKCRFIILSNGEISYFWDLFSGNPYRITKFPDPASLDRLLGFIPEPATLVNETVADDYIVLTQNPLYAQNPSWLDPALRNDFIFRNKLKFLRKYQLDAIRSLQATVKVGGTRFLFEMATGTGKTLTTAAVIKLFLKTGNARRVLFLVDRIELEEQAHVAFKDYLKNDYSSVIFKENRDDWHKAEIVVTTVQSLLFDNKYRRIFSPTDFDLTISDEAHRSIGANSRAIFDYFTGYKLGLTATPKDYLKKIDKVDDPRDIERRMLLDTYRTFGCDSGNPTFRYSLLDGVKDGFLINPIVTDARTEITTQLLSDEGYAAVIKPDDENELTSSGEKSFTHKDYEKKFFSDATNRTFCNAFMEKALRDPVTGEIGKSIVFAVSQNHATKITQILNEIAHRMFPGKYQSDFALQVTSAIPDAQSFTRNFTNNNLKGSCNFNPVYKTSKTRVCVTVGMMTTGYDCPDILNIALMRPIFSPTDFIQIKGRGTRKHNFAASLMDESLRTDILNPEKKVFKLFDFFANCEYFEEKFNYDEILKLPKPSHTPPPGPPEPPPPPEGYNHNGTDELKHIHDKQIGFGGMKIDRMFFNTFEDKIRNDHFISRNFEEENWDVIIEYVKNTLFDKPEDFVNLDKLKRAAELDRKISVREIVEKALGRIPKLKSKYELLEDEFDKFISDLNLSADIDLSAVKYFFIVYISNPEVRKIIDNRDFAGLLNNSSYRLDEFRRIPPPVVESVREYVNTYVSLSIYN
ncbi:MAG: DEAD/DEAH box helicase family protein [Ignavibacteriaceae bacterium]|jgi:type I restriction enzyme R subunit|nr:DEAD/DEAH box helicase family protein [Ignavibacteriaceae bacterium]